MDAKENALRIIRFDNPERIVRKMPIVECTYFGCDLQSFGGLGQHSPAGTRWYDIWGVGWQKELEGVMGLSKVHPLADLSTLDSYSFPDPDDPRLIQPVYDRAAEADRDSFFLRGRHRETLWEKCYNLVGMDNLMMAFMDSPGAVKELLHRTMDFNLGIARHYAEVGIDIAGLGDDLGGQDALLFNPDILYEFFVPEYRRLAEFYRERDVLLGFHSCGHIEPILDMFMDLGVNILNPIQATANNLDTVRAKTRGRMALSGGVSTHTIMTGPVEAIRKETRLRMWQLGREGGYFCGPDQGLPFPEEHMQALNETVEQYGVYPLIPVEGQ